MRIMNFMIKLSEQSRSGASIIRSIKKQIHNILILPVLVSFIVLSCEEDPSSIGGNILPQTDFDSLVATDTINVEMYTLFTDSASSFNTSLSYLGASLDPYFGLTTADFVTQLWLAAAWPGDGINSIDSVKMYLLINNVYKEKTGMSTVNIYDTDEVLSVDSIYLVGRDIPIKELIGSFELPPLREGRDTTLIIDLPVSFGEYILRDTSLLYLRSDTIDFRNYVKGLYFEYPQTMNHHMLELNMVNESTFFEIYYTDTQKESRSYRLTIKSSCLNYNRFLHDFEQADPDKKIKYINEPVKDTLGYAQGMEGVYTKMVIPGLEFLKSLPYDVAINKARIYLPVYLNEVDYTEEMVPSNILVRYDSAGSKRILTDYLVDAAFLDGSYNKVNNQYKLNIANFVQQYYEGEILEPVIEIYLPELSKENLIIKANREGEENVKFELTYTVLKEQ